MDLSVQSCPQLDVKDNSRKVPGGPALFQRFKTRVSPTSKANENLGEWGTCTTCDSSENAERTTKSPRRCRHRHGNVANHRSGHGEWTLAAQGQAEKNLEQRGSVNIENTGEGQPVNPLPSRTSLLGLPRELRDMIFAYVCCDWSSGSKPFSILGICQQLNYEIARAVYQEGLARVQTEHWPDQDFFWTAYMSKVPAMLRSSLHHLALPLPRGMPFDRYASNHLPAELAALGLQLKSLVMYSHVPRPLPQISVYGGVLETNFCLWLKRTLYSMPSLIQICILNYESPTPAVYDMLSPRLIRMLRSSIFEDVMAECETMSEQRFEWRCLTDSLESSMSNCTADEKTYHIYSSKLARSVEIVFRSEKFLADYGLEHVIEKRAQVMLQSKLLLQECLFEPDRRRTISTRRRALTWHRKDTSLSEQRVGKHELHVGDSSAVQAPSKSSVVSSIRAFRWKLSVSH